MAVSCRLSNELPGSVKDMAFLDELSILLASQEGLRSVQLVMGASYQPVCSTEL